MSVEPTLLDGYLKQLRLTTFIRNHAQFAQDAAVANESYDQFLLALSREEVAQRDHNRQLQRVRAAQFPLLKELIDFDFSAIPQLNQQRILELARGQYINQAEPIILLGNPGLGKTHIATSLAIEACRQFHRVRFYNVAALVNDLIAAQQNHTLDKFIATAQRHKLIVLDELGFIPFSNLGSHLIFQFCSALYERVSLIITTNLNFADWTHVFGDEKLTLALLDRLTHKAHVIEFVGESYRFRQRLHLDTPAS